MRPIALLSTLLVALFGLIGCGGNGDGNTAETDAITAETGIDPGAGSQNFSVALNPAAEGTEMGSANVTAAAGEQVRVTIQLEGAEETLPADIREGTCEDLGTEPAHELSEVEAGRSETLLDASMDELRTTPYAIVVGADHGGREPYVACGELVGDATGG